MTTERHPATTGVLRYFTYGHLPQRLQPVSREFAEMAQWLVDLLPDSPELTTALRKLLEAKDCAVRARLDDTTSDETYGPAHGNNSL